MSFGIGGKMNIGDKKNFLLVIDSEKLANAVGAEKMGVEATVYWTLDKNPDPRYQYASFITNGNFKISKDLIYE